MIYIQSIAFELSVSIALNYLEIYSEFISKFVE